MNDTVNETVWVPIVVSGSQDPNPAIAFQPVKLRFMIIDVFGAEQEELHISNEFVSGEV